MLLVALEQDKSLSPGTPALVAARGRVRLEKPLWRYRRTPASPPMEVRFVPFMTVATRASLTPKTPAAM